MVDGYVIALTSDVDAYVLASHGSTEDYSNNINYTYTVTAPQGKLKYQNCTSTVTVPQGIGLFTIVNIIYSFFNS